MHGLTLILAAAVLWGASIFISKVAVTTVDPWTAALVRSLVFFPIVGGYVTRRARGEWTTRNLVAYGLGAGILTGLSVLSTRLALTAYDVSVVSPVKRLSLLVTVGVSVAVFDETLTRRKLVGILAAVAALLFLS